MDAYSSPLPNDDLSYAVQHTGVCLATDPFTDPLIGKWFQNRFGDAGHATSLKETMAGEFAGDGIAALLFLALQRFVPQVTESLTNWSEHWLAPLYDRVIDKPSQEWAEAHHCDVNSAQFQERRARLRHFEAKSVARSTVIAAASIAANVTWQKKMMGNTQSLSVIAGGKAAGAAVTMGVMLLPRMLLPHTAQTLDKELNARYFTPLTDWLGRVCGAVAPVPAR